MPRRPRIVLPATPVHIVQRGHNRERCFFDDRDYRVYLRMLADVAGERGCAIHAYVLMTNHVHLLLTPERAESPALLMKNLGQRYVQYVNRKHKRSGTLWEGRFRSCAVQDEGYFLCCHRYIELNPVRAGLAPHPRDYPWSSYRHNAEGIATQLVSPHPVYQALADRDEARRATYRALFEAALEPSTLEEVRLATNANLALGDAMFRAQVEAAYRGLTPMWISQ
ncbi:MAG: transposase [Betaproteobacteria bacterium]|nr:MAG: transposase [Betaproteobacteria bacterium]